MWVVGQSQPGSVLRYQELNSKDDHIPPNKTPARVSGEVGDATRRMHFGTARDQLTCSKAPTINLSVSKLWPYVRDKHENFMLQDDHTV